MAYYIFNSCLCKKYLGYRAKSLYFWLVLVFVLGSLALLQPAQAQPAPGTNLGKRVALLVGNSDYPGGKAGSHPEDWDPLRNSINDARALGLRLRELGFEVEVAENLKKQQMVEAINRLAVRGKGAQAVLFYFAGHGAPIGSTNYIMPVDTEPLDAALMSVESKGISLSSILRPLQEIEGGTKIVLLDACRKLPGLRNKPRGLASGGLAPPDQTPDDTVLVFATQPGRIAYDGVKGNSPFVLGLLNGLAKQANLSNVLLTASETTRSETSFDPAGIKRIEPQRPHVVADPSTTAKFWFRAPDPDPRDLQLAEARRNEAELRRELDEFRKRQAAGAASITSAQPAPLTSAMVAAPQPPTPATASAPVVAEQKMSAAMRIKVERIRARPITYKELKLLVKTLDERDELAKIFPLDTQLRFVNPIGISAIGDMLQVMLYDPDPKLHANPADALSNFKRLTLLDGQLEVAERWMNFYFEKDSAAYKKMARILNDTRKVQGFAPADTLLPIPPPATQPAQEVAAYPGGPVMVTIARGSYLRGIYAEVDRSDNEGLTSTVTIAYTLQLGKTEVTRQQFAQFVQATGYRTEAERNYNGCEENRVNTEWNPNYTPTNWRNPGFDQTDSHPVVCISWDDAQKYIDWVNDKAGIAKTSPNRFRLPSEAEFEYAARGGTGSSQKVNIAQHTRFYYGDDIDYKMACLHGNFAYVASTNKIFGRLTSGCDDGYIYTAPVGSFATSATPHPFGLFDLLGNVQEWVQDCKVNYSRAPTNGQAYEETQVGESCYRVARGGSWHNAPSISRSADRGLSYLARTRNNFTGLRLARTIL